MSAERFAETLDGAAVDEGMPVHYDLHVWVWQHNPAGMFEQFNPAGAC